MADMTKKNRASAIYVPLPLDGANIVNACTSNASVSVCSETLVDSLLGSKYWYMSGGWLKTGLAKGLKYLFTNR